MADEQKVAEALRFLAGTRVFVTTREKIKQPEGAELFDESIAALCVEIRSMRQRIADLERVNASNAEQLADIRQLTAPLFKNVDPMPGDCMIGVNRSVTAYGYVSDVVKQFQASRAKLAQAEHDARRYRWLRDNCYVNEYSDRPAPYALIRVCVGEDEKHTNWMTPGHSPGVGVPSLDSTVDAAMRAAIDGSGEGRP